MSLSLIKKLRQSQNDKFPAENCDMLCWDDDQAYAYDYLKNNFKIRELNTTSSKMKFSE